MENINMKIVSCMVVASLLFYIGCYSTDPITKDELKATAENDINVMTKDSLEYRFNKGDYSIQGDTLSGTGVQVIWEKGKLTFLRFHGSISFSEITTLTAEKFSAGKTTAAIVIPIALAVGFLVWFGDQMAKGH
jgi:hypothetical protein